MLFSRLQIFTFSCLCWILVGFSIVARAEVAITKTPASASNDLNLKISIENPSLQKLLNPPKAWQTYPLVGATSKMVKQPVRIVRFELSRVDQAKAYEVEIIPRRTLDFEAQKFTVSVKNPILNLRMYPREYGIRTRALNADGDVGPWSRSRLLWITFASRGPIFPEPEAKLEARDEANELISFEWPETTEAQAYFFVLKNEDDEIIKKGCYFRTWTTETLPVEKKYRWSVTPLSNSIECGLAAKYDRLLVYSNFSITAPQTKSHLTEVSVKPDRLAVKYQFEVTPYDRDGQLLKPVHFVSHHLNFQVRLKHGEYQLRARTLYSDQTLSPWSEAKNFFIKIRAPKLLSPMAGEVIESTDDEESKVSFKWEGDEDAHFYKLFIYDEKGQVVQQYTTESSEIDFKLPHHQTYQWQVKPYLSSREPASLDEPLNPKASSQFQINEYIKLDLSPAEESSQYYAWGRYIVSVVNYVGRNYDQNSLTSQNLFGGEGELAAGTWDRKKSTGYLGHISLAGFTYQSQNYTYANAGFHYGHRVVLKDQARLRYWIGATYQELPEVIPQPFSNVVLYSKIKSLGPQLQLSYMNAFNKTWGWNTQASVFYEVLDLGTPNGLKQNTSYSYKIGLFGTYVPQDKSLFSFKDHKWLFGYTYKADHATYKTSDPKNIENSTSVTGHYLSFSLEVALEDSQK